MLAGLRDADLWSMRDPFLDSGIEALRGSRFVEAAATLTRAATANPKSGPAQLLLAEAYRAAGLPGAAEVAYRAAIERDPDLPAAWNGLGSCLAGRGRTDEARLAFLRALQIDPALAPARNNLGALLLSTGDDVGAESALRSALAIDPAGGRPDAAPASSPPRRPALPAASARGRASAPERRAASRRAGRRTASISAPRGGAAEDRPCRPWGSRSPHPPGSSRRPSAASA